MSTKVLVFESDSAFASELRNELGKLGCTTTVVEDGNAGLQTAASDKPDLILLSIELPRMNGFSVCNKLKKDAALREVPLIIMSSESSEETFEQHKKLRTRAEDYVHKPIAFGELLQHIQPFVNLGAGEPDAGGGIVIDDEVQIEDSLSQAPPGFGSGTASQPPRNHPSLRAVDAEVDAFAESAFGRITGSVAPEAPAHSSVRAPSSGRPQSTHPSNRPSSSGMPSARPTANGAAAAIAAIEGGELERLRDEAAREKMRAAELEQTLERQASRTNELSNELQKLRADNQQLHSDVAVANQAVDAAGRSSEEDVTRLQRELDELRAKLSTAGKSGGVSAREFLELRENLNKKDKEILQLKETVSRRDKELIEARDRSLSLERTKQGSDDKILGVERQLADIRDKNDSLAADRDQAKKIADEIRGKVTRLTGELEARAREIEELRARHAEEIAAQEAAVNEMKTELTDSWAKRLEDARDEHVREMELAREDQKKALEQAAAAKQRDIARLKDEQELAMREADASATKVRAAAVAERQAELSEQYATELNSRLADHQDEVASLRADYLRQLEHAETKRQGDVVAAERAAAEKLTARERELERLQGLALASLATDKDAAIAAKEREAAAIVEQKDEAIAAIERDRDERVGALQRERDQQIARLERDRSEQISAIEKDRDTLVAALEQDRDDRLAALEHEKNDVIANLERERDERVAEAQRERDERIARIERERDERVASLSRASEEAVAAAERDREHRLEVLRGEHDVMLGRLQREHSVRLGEVERDRDERVDALSRELGETRTSAEAARTQAEGRIAALESDYANTRAELDALIQIKDETDASNIARITDLDERLSTSTAKREEVERDLLSVRNRASTLESEVSELRSELDALKRRLAFESGRADRAFAKWEADRLSLDRAKDALALVLTQIEDAEGRAID